MNFPGFSAPAAGFDQPIEMLHACHDRVRRSLDLLRRICAEPDVHDAVQVLRWEHDEMRSRWAMLRGALAALAGGDAGAFGKPERDAAVDFIALYEKHAQTEERFVFPLAARMATAQEIEDIGAEMAQRRGVRPAAKVA